MKSEYLTFGEIIQKSTVFLEGKGVPSAKLDSEWIISHSVGIARMELYLRFNELVPLDKISEIRDRIVKRGTRVPLQHVLKSVQFCDLELKSDKRALVPRPETERLVEIAVSKLSKAFNGEIVDLGTGSGAIILSLCHHLPNASGLGLDNSIDAISLAKENSTNLKLSDRVQFCTYDWMDKKDIGEVFDVLISNPPYLSESEWLSSQPEVKSFDPKNALVSGNNGMDHLRHISAISSNILKKDGLIFLEVGKGQAIEVVEMLAGDFKEIEVLKDFSGIRRFVIGKRN